MSIILLQLPQLSSFPQSLATLSRRTQPCAPSSAKSIEAEPRYKPSLNLTNPPRVTVNRRNLPQDFP